MGASLDLAGTVLLPFGSVPLAPRTNNMAAAALKAATPTGLSANRLATCRMASGLTCPTKRANSKN
jgi:hypothetical protein